MTVRLLITGGTIDDLDYTSEKTPLQKRTSLIPELLRHARVTLECHCDEVFQKDSRHLNESDRDLLLRKCKECSEEKIIITHGTMTMSKTAQFLGGKNIPKTIVILGAMIPANKKNSDAMFNLGAALSAVQLLPHGVYLTMNGKIFPWNNVRKNLKKGVFETSVGDDS